MKPSSKGLAIILLITLAVSSLSPTIGNATCARPPPATPDPHIPIPAVPQFNLRFIDNSYDVPETPRSYQDPYTGDVTTTIEPGYHVMNYTMEITIKNQAYPAKISGHPAELHYGVQTKGHFGEQWREIGQDASIVASDRGSTGVYVSANHPERGQVDVQVKADLGFYYDYQYGMATWVVFDSESSSWSNTKTITIPDQSGATVQPDITSTPNSLNSESNQPKAEDTIPLTTFAAVVIVFVAIIAALTVTLLRKHRKKQKQETCNC